MQSSNSQENKPSAAIAVAVWLCRLAVGAVFAVSGWAKAVDPAGFIIKVGEYLSVWHLSVPHEAIVAGCIALATVEFATGITIASGCLRGVSVWCAAAMMLFMLPLTAYIAIANPVADCGCFGDLFIISNGATFAKNVAISAAVVFLLLRNRRVSGIYPAAIQWLAVTVSMAFPLFLAFVGYHIQPVADFRPFGLGTTIFHPYDGNDSGEALFVYERGGERRTFGLDSLPDDSWTFVESLDSSVPDGADIAVRDEDGEDVSYDLVSDSDPQVWLIVPDPGLQFLSRSHLVNELSRYLDDLEIDFTALVGNRGAGYDYWTDLTRPTFPVYSAEDTSLEQLARGNAALVYTRAGRIVWKRTLSSLPDNLLDTQGDTAPEEANLIKPNVLDGISAVDDGHLAWLSVLIFLSALAVLYLLGQSPKLLRLLSFR